MSEYVLETVKVGKSFPSVRALNDVSINVRKGEILGLIGENGAGKSTLLKIINGIYPINTYEGGIMLNGEKIAFKSAHDALLKGIGFVPQEINIMEDLTVAENIYVGHIEGSKKRFVSVSSMIKSARKLLSGIKINLDAGITAKRLSIGQKQLLMIARVLSWNPDVLILDEPTTALSQEDVDRLFDIIKHQKSEGKSIVFVTHKMEEIILLTDRVTILRDGEVINTFDREHYERDKIITDMVGRTINNLYPTRTPKIGEEVLRVENLSVDHPKILDKKLIYDVSFNVRKGEVLGIVGLVGAGRTEVVSTIYGSYKGYGGEIYVNGEKVHIKDESDAIRNGISLVTEDRKENGLLLLNDIKANISISNLKKIQKGAFLNKKVENAVVDDYMSKLRIKAPSRNTMVVNLSGGNQQKVVVAKTLNSDPKILMLDEPTKGIDVGTKNEIYELINEFASEGIGVIMVSSELPELLGMCDRFVIMNSGTIVAEVSAEEATQESLMAYCLE